MAELDEEARVDPAELLELVSGLRDKDTTLDDQPDNGEYRKGENCLYFSKAIMRTLRREQRAGGFSAMSQLVRWEIPKSDVVPLVLSYRRDRALVVSLIKILVALTLPVTRVFDGVQDHLEKLQSCKELFVNHDLLAIFMGLLVEPLAREERTKEDNTVMDALLNLFHNLLHIRSPAKPHLEDLLLKALVEANVLDFFVVVAQAVDADANRKWAMLLTNIFHLLSDGLVPEDLCFAFHSSHSFKECATTAEAAAMAKVMEAEATSRLKNIRSKEKQRLKEEKFRLSRPRSVGTLIKEEPDGTRKVIPADRILVPIRSAPKVKPRQKAPAPWDRVDRELSVELKARLFTFFETFVVNNVFSVLMQEAAAAISDSDLEDAFLPSFQADVNRYIRLIAWFVRFDCVRQLQAMRLKEDPKDVRREHPVLDQVPKQPQNQTFTLEHIEAVLNSATVEFLFQRAEHSLALKPVAYRDVHIIFRALGEILNTCGYIMCNGSMALRYEAKKTLYRIFLDRRQFLDRLPWLLQHVVLSKMPKHFLISLVNTVDLTFTILEKIEEIDRGIVVLKKKRKGHHSSRNARDDHEEVQQGGENEEQMQARLDEQEKMERFNDFNELQTQDFQLSDYIRKFQHNKLVEICTVLLDECESNTDELNTSIWRLFDRIRTGAGNANAALPAIFCQARVLNIFARLLTQRANEGKAMRSTLAELADFGEHIVGEIMRLTAGGANAHIFPALLFWRSLRENQDFEDLNFRMALEDAQRQPGYVDEDEADSVDEVALFDDNEILMDPELIAASVREEEARKAAEREKRKSRAPKKPKSAWQLFFMDEKAKVPELTIAAFKPVARELWDACAPDVKEQYSIKAREDRERYAREMEAYVPSEDDDGDEYVDDESKGAKKRRHQQEEAVSPASVKRREKAEERKFIYDGADSSSSSEDLPLAKIYAERIRRAAVQTPKKKKKTNDKKKKNVDDNHGDGQPPSSSPSKKPRVLDDDEEENDDDFFEDLAALIAPPKVIKSHYAPAAAIAAPAPGERIWTPQEDAELRTQYREVREREASSIPRVLSARLQNLASPATKLEIVERLHALQLISQAHLDEMRRACTT